MQVHNQAGYRPTQPGQYGYLNVTCVAGAAPSDQDRVQVKISPKAYIYASYKQLRCTLPLGLFKLPHTHDMPLYQN